MLPCKLIQYPTFLMMQNRLHWREMNCVMITVCFAVKSWSFTTSFVRVIKATLFGARIVQDQLLQHLIPQAECSQHNILHIYQSSLRRHYLCNLPRHESYSSSQKFHLHPLKTVNCHKTRGFPIVLHGLRHGYLTPAVVSSSVNQFPILPRMGEEQQYSGTSEEHGLHRV
jgi:hypothetical protein